MKKETVIMILESLASEYSKNLGATERALKIRNWSTILRDITDEQGMTGLEKALESPSEFMPPVGKFKEMCLSGPGSMSLEDEGAMAWALVMKNFNPCIAPIFRDTSISETINKMGGWIGFCESLTDRNQDFKRRDFINLYVMCRARKEVFSPLPDRVAKIFQNGKELPDYRFIGFQTDNGKKEALRQIEQANSEERKCLEMLVGGN